MANAQLQKGFFFDSLFNVDVSVMLLKGKICVLHKSVQKFIEIKAWLLSTFFICTFHCHLLKSTDV